MLRSCKHGLFSQQFGQSLLMHRHTVAQEQEAFTKGKNGGNIFLKLQGYIGQQTFGGMPEAKAAP